MVEKYFDSIETFEEINGHFNKNFKVKTNDGLFHLKIFKNGKTEIRKWIDGETVKKWDIASIQLLDIQLKQLNGKAPLMDLINLGIKDNKYLSLLEKYKNDRRVYCHNDLNKDNVILKGREMTLIDFEFARMNHPYWEYANIIVEDKVDINIFLKAIPSLKRKILEDWIYINREYTCAWNKKWKNK